MTTSAFAQNAAPAPAPPATYHLQLNDADIGTLGQALQELPKRLADPLIAKINTQLQAQAPKPPAEPGKDDKVAPSKEKAK